MSIADRSFLGEESMINRKRSLGLVLVSWFLDDRILLSYYGGGLILNRIHYRWFYQREP